MEQKFSLQSLITKIDTKINKEVDSLTAYAAINKLAQQHGISKQIFQISMENLLKIAKRLKPVYVIVIERYPETKPLLDAIYENNKGK